MTTSWGASKEDWAHLDLILGLGPDLLPVVSNPNAKVSPGSKMKALGKTPSIYNRVGLVAGIPKWTEKRATDAEIEKWSEVADYGICIQTRRVRAFDIDVEDSDRAMEIANGIANAFPWLKGKWSFRQRNNSGKLLLPFIMTDPLPKRSLPVHEGMVEVLGDGQQFVACGVHTSGSRYVWNNGKGLPDTFLEINSEHFEQLWDALVKKWGTGTPSIAKAKREGQLTHSNIVDDVIPYLTVLSWSNDEGKAFIECPFKSEHTGDSGETETCYQPAGTGGYERGHFKCLHAHCQGRSDDDFLEALGIGTAMALAGFDIVEAVEGEQLPVLLDYELRCNDDGKTLATVENLHAVLVRPDLCGQDIRYDTFRDEIVYRKNAGEAWQPFKDTDYTRLRIELALTGFLPIGREIIRDCVHYAAGLRRFDTAIEWLSGLEWDGVKRVETFMSRYMAAEDSAYTRSVANYMWAALAGRVLSPGCKADAAVILVGEQYVGKSFAVASIVPDKRFFTEMSFADIEEDLSRKMRGKLIAEFGELKGLHSQNKDTETIKAFISRQDEEWVPKYMEFTTVYPRRLLFIGTSNKEEFLLDETGNRRFFPLKVTKGEGLLIQRDRNQLWAEGAELFKSKGVEFFYSHANELAEKVRPDHMITDVWHDSICEWLYEKDVDGTRPIDNEYLQIKTVMQGALNLDTRNMKDFDAKRIGRVLKNLGYKKAVRRVGGYSSKVWVLELPQTNP